MDSRQPSGLGDDPTRGLRATSGAPLPRVPLGASAAVGVGGKVGGGKSGSSVGGGARAGEMGTGR